MKDYKQAQENNISVLKMIYSYILGTMNEIKQQIKDRIKGTWIVYSGEGVIMDMNWE